MYAFTWLVPSILRSLCLLNRFHINMQHHRSGENHEGVRYAACPGPLNTWIFTLSQVTLLSVTFFSEESPSALYSSCACRSFDRAPMHLTTAVWLAPTPQKPCVSRPEVCLGLFNLMFPCVPPPPPRVTEQPLIDRSAELTWGDTEDTIFAGPPLQCITTH
jgi:hypothetical protein